MATKAFHISTTKELLAIKDRVRDLINHWGEDGRYKEAVLKSIIQRFLPGRYVIASGFVVKQALDNNFGHVSSRQIDLLIYDTNYPVLFKESDFVIVTPDAVKAIIEVKANLRNQGLENVLRRCNSLGQFIFEGRENDQSLIFNGIFSYTGYNNNNIEVLLQQNISHINEEFDNIQNSARFKVNHISFNKDWFYKFWPEDNLNSRNNIYRIEDLSFAYFISNLMDFLSGNSVFENHDVWFPIDKEFELKGTF